MGAETSTLQSVESLNHSLSAIEEKLQAMEHIISTSDAEQSGGCDNYASVSDKLIPTSPYVDLTVGPVVGLVGSEFAYVLVEVNKDTEISLNVFQVDNRYGISSKPKFIYDMKFKARKNKPISRKLSDLESDTNYIVIVGGVKSSDALENYASFRTLPINGSSIPTRIIFTHQSRVDQNLPDEKSIWPDVEERVTSSTRNPLLETSDSKSNKDIHIPVHMIVHNGCFLSFEDKIKTKVYELLDMMMSVSHSMDSMTEILDEIEKIIADSYRQAFSQPYIKQLFRKCGQIFIAGETESVANLLTLLVKELLNADGGIPDLTIKKQDSREQTSHDFEGSNEDNVSNSENVQLENNVSSVSESKNVSDVEAFLSSNEMKAASDADRQAVLDYIQDKTLRDKRSDSFQKIFDQESSFEASVNDSSKDLTQEEYNEFMENSLLDYVKYHENFCKQARKSVAGLVVRIARRTFWAYMKSLRDSNTESAILEDLALESRIREILIADKKMLQYREMYSYLHTAKVKLANEHEASKLALKQLTARITSLLKDIRSVEQHIDSLRSLFVNEQQRLKLSNINSQSGVLYDLNGTLLFLIDSAWEYLSNDGNIRDIPYGLLETSLTENIMAELDEFMNDWPTSDIAKPRSSIIVVSSSPIIPSFQEFDNVKQQRRTTNQLPLLNANDSIGLIEKLCHWQSNSKDNVAVIAMPNIDNQDPKHGWLVPSRSQGFDSGRNDENTSSLVTILLSSLQQRTRIKGTAKYLLEESWEDKPSPSRSEISNEGFEASFKIDETMVPVVGRSYWDVLAMNIVKHSNSKVLASCCGPRNKNYHGTVTVGPIIGRIDRNHVTLLLELSEDGYIELNAVDAVLGIKHTCLQKVLAYLPTRFMFSSLQSGHTYDLTFGDLVISTFTTIAPTIQVVIPVSMPATNIPLVTNTPKQAELKRTNTVTNLNSTADENTAQHDLKHDKRNSIERKLSKKSIAEFSRRIINLDVGRSRADSSASGQSSARSRRMSSGIAGLLGLGSEDHQSAMEISSKTRKSVDHRSLNASKKASTNILSPRRMSESYVSNKSIRSFSARRMSKNLTAGIANLLLGSLANVESDHHPKGRLERSDFNDDNSDDESRKGKRKKLNIKRSKRLSSKNSTRKTDDQPKVTNEIIPPEKENNTQNVVVQPEVKSDLPENQLPPNSSNLNIIVMGSEFRDNYLDDTNTVEAGHSFRAEISEIACKPFSSVQAILHIGEYTDFSSYRDEFISLATQLDYLMTSGSQDSVYNINVSHHEGKYPTNGSNVSSLISRIEELVRHVYRLSWHASTSNRSMLNSSSHIFFSDSTCHLTLLSIFEANCFDDVERSLNLSTIRALLTILSSVKRQYLPVHQPELGLSATLGIGEVVLFNLNPRWSTWTNEQLYSPDLISPSEICQLEKVATEVSSKQNVVLVLVSPIPLLLPTPNEKVVIRAGISYSNSDITRVLTAVNRLACTNRLVAQNVIDSSKSTNERVLLFCSGGCSSTAKITASSSFSTFSLNQICCGPILSKTSPSYQYRSSNINQTFDTAPKNIVLTNDWLITCTFSFAANQFPLAGLISGDNLSAKVSADLLALPDLSTRIRAPHIISRSSKGLELIWNDIVKHINAFDIDNTLSVDVSCTVDTTNLDDTAMSMLRGVDKILNDKYSDEFDECHEHYVDEIQPLYQRAGREAVRGIIHSWQECLTNRLPANVSAMLPVPSTVSVLAMLELYQYKVRKGADILSIPEADDPDYTNDAVSLGAVLASLVSDTEFFLEFMRHTMEAQLLSEHFSLTRGYHLEPIR